MWTQEGLATVPPWKPLSLSVLGHGKTQISWLNKLLPTPGKVLFDKTLDILTSTAEEVGALTPSMLCHCVQWFWKVWCRREGTCCTMASKCGIRASLRGFGLSGLVKARQVAEVALVISFPLDSQPEVMCFWNWLLETGRGKQEPDVSMSLLSHRYDQWAVASCRQCHSFSLPVITNSVLISSSKYHEQVQTPSAFLAAIYSIGYQSSTSCGHHWKTSLNYFEAWLICTLRTSCDALFQSPEPWESGKHTGNRQVNKIGSTALWKTCTQINCWRSPGSSQHPQHTQYKISWRWSLFMNKNPKTNRKANLPFISPGCSEVDVELNGLLEMEKS